MRTYDELKGDLYTNIDKYKEDAIALNEFVGTHPELSGEEYEGSKYIVNYLRGEGFDVEYPFDGMATAFKAVYGKDNHTRKIAIMAEYDALPEIGHACGHCTSCATSVLAARSLIQFQDELDVDIHVIGTPTEETDGAKALMVDHGVFNQYSMAIMLHMYDCNIISPVALALDSYLYTFHGKAAHASSAPWEGVNAFNAVQLMFHGMDMLRQHVKPDVRIHGIVRYPGEAPNIVPEKCSAEVYCRSREREYLDTVAKKIDNCAEGAAIATGTTWEKEPTANSYDNIKRNETGCRLLKESYEEVGLFENGDVDDIFGSTDAGNVSFVCPTFHPTIQLVDKGVAIHTKDFEVCSRGEKANEVICNGAKIIGLQVIKVFSSEENYRNMMDDFGGK